MKGKEGEKGFLESSMTEDSGLWTVDLVLDFFRFIFEICPHDLPEVCLHDLRQVI